MSTNAANAFSSGIKGRYREVRIDDDHQLKNAVYPVAEFSGGKIEVRDAPALTAINMRLRDDYTRDASGGVVRWNVIIKKQDIDFEMKLPHEGFHRKIGTFAGRFQGSFPSSGVRRNSSRHRLRASSLGGSSTTSSSSRQSDRAAWVKCGRRSRFR